MFYLFFIPIPTINQVRLVDGLVQNVISTGNSSFSVMAKESEKVAPTLMKAKFPA